MAHFRSENAHSRLKKRYVVLKEPPFITLACFVIRYLLAKHLLIGYFLTKGTRAEFGPLRAEPRRGPHHAGPLAHIGPQTPRVNDAPPPPPMTSMVTFYTI